MSKAWHEIAKETMGRDFKPVASEDKPKLNPEWSDYTGRKKQKRKK